MTQLARAAAFGLSVALSVVLAGCSTLEEALMSPGPMVTAQGSTGGPTGTPTGGLSATPTGTSPTTTAVVDQSTPEAAMESWLTALVAGEGEDVCSLMAIDGRAVSSIKGAAADCGESLTPLLSSLTELGDMFGDVEIVGATVVDDLATFEAATTKPALAAQVIHRFKTVKIKDEWFVTD